MPSSNGLAERAVRELKIRLNKMSADQVSDRISKWLFFYRTTRHATTGETPSRLLLGYQPVTRFDRLKPSLERNVRTKQFTQVQQHKKRHPTSRPTLSPGDMVLARYYRQADVVDPWSRATAIRTRRALVLERALAPPAARMPLRRWTLPWPRQEEARRRCGLRPLSTSTSRGTLFGRPRTAEPRLPPASLTAWERGMPMGKKGAILCA
ncbi:uncharacterized protein LOC122383498 [Amphibalanus amphitrite]|uniref:uncharacterized protein LOC122383498 n=1 Tax=Amphibalanus amphitrite TaxID=1232801 RepID=UPI001C90553B|nr:uncharacterized protein LOC122383498 [Amphibalanus amphitrite]